jgi:hypothetical protein
MLILSQIEYPGKVFQMISVMFRENLTLLQNKKDHYPAHLLKDSNLFLDVP